VLRHEHKQAVQRKHTQHAAKVDGPREEVAKQQRVAQVRQHERVQLHEHFLRGPGTHAQGLSAQHMIATVATRLIDVEGKLKPQK
jgi:hypothetical protein